ncbi:MAG: 30S ribosomal protein S4, partial [Candidatus Paceibacteria bacterium]
QSEYGKQLKEKQKVRHIYGLKEKQMRKYYQEARRRNEPTPSAMLSLLEERLDNVVFRSGIATTRDMARQFVSHGHIMVNDKVVTIPSYVVKEGDVLRISSAGLRNKTLHENKEQINPQEIPTWLEYDPKEVSFTVTHSPQGDQETQNFDLTLVVQFYSR